MHPIDWYSVKQYVKQNILIIVILFLKGFDVSVLFATCFHVQWKLFESMVRFHVLECKLHCTLILYTCVNSFIIVYSLLMFIIREILYRLLMQYQFTFLLYVKVNQMHFVRQKKHIICCWPLERAYSWFYSYVHIVGSWSWFFVLGDYWSSMIFFCTV
jgi:hypothetical protein